MKFFFNFFACFFCFFCKSSIVIPKFDARFGDKLSCIYYALCISYKYDIKLFCPDFEYSDKLVIHDIIPKINHNNFNRFEKVILITKESDIDQNNKNVLYQVDYYLKMNFNKDIHEKAIKKFKLIILPKNKIKLPSCLSLSCPKVAVHVRKGGGFDAPLLYRTFYADQRWPLKFPPDDYYIDQIKKIFLILKSKPLHVHIFTDDKNPEKIVEKYKRLINQPLITFSSRVNNNFEENTIEDFFIMTKFNYLIRPQSSYSFNVQRLGNFKIVMFPNHAIISDKNLIIDSVNILKRLYEL